jgi:two-component system OmpR family response regulator
MKQTTLQKKTRILIVEDEGDMCLLLNIMLKEKETDVDHVKTLSAAKEFMEKEKPSIVILDNKLPDGFGIDLIGLIRKKYPSIKIIMISGFAPTAKDVALYNGADIFLEKPFTKEQLYNAVKELTSGVANTAEI